MTPADPTERLLQKLAEARTWADRFQRDLVGGYDVASQIEEADKCIQALEIESKDAMKRLGCVSPQTRTVYHAMADMLIAWQMFKDTYIETE
jgi:hypothetical protein